MGKVILFLMAIIMVGIVLYLLQPGTSNRLDSLGKVSLGQLNVFSKITEDLLGKELEKISPQNLVDLAKREVRNQAIETVENVNQRVEQASEKVIDNFLGTTPQPSPTTSQSVPNFISLNPTKDRGLKLNLIKNKKYYLKLEGTSPGLCLYVGSKKFEAGEGNQVELEFSESGTFPIKVDSCTQGKNIGEIVIN